jgi:hypothetical protein
MGDWIVMLGGFVITACVFYGLGVLVEDRRHRKLRAKERQAWRDGEQMRRYNQ